MVFIAGEHSSGHFAILTAEFDNSDGCYWVATAPDRQGDGIGNHITRADNEYNMPYNFQTDAPALVNTVEFTVELEIGVPEMKSR